MKEQKNKKIAVMAALITTLGMLLICVGHLKGILPDWAMNAVGVVLTLCMAAVIVFCVSKMAKSGRNNSQNEEKE